MKARPLAHALLSFGPAEPLARRISMLAGLGLALRVRGEKRVPRRGPLVVASTHPGPADLSSLDAALGRRLAVVADSDLLATPLLGRLLRNRGAIAIGRVVLGGNPDNAASLAEAAAAVRDGDAVAIFPEGLGHGFGSGAVRIAAAAQAPVLPVAILPIGGERAPLRRLVYVRRPLPPPRDDPRGRREFLRRLRTRHVSGEEMREPFAMALDDPRLWRHPPAAVRRAARVARLEGPARRRFLRAAAALRRGCAALRCSVGELRDPPGLRHLAAYLALLAPAAAGLLLCAPLILGLRLATARLGPARIARIQIGFALAGPYGLALAAAGLAFLGARGLLLPVAALPGLCCYGLAGPLHRKVGRMLRVRREGPRLRRLLAAFDDAIYAERLSADLRARTA